MKLTLVFDIGKTNKKCFLFDENFYEVFREQRHIAEIKDEDGFICDDINSTLDWMKMVFYHIWEKWGAEIRAMNFSGYGASFVHIDKNGDIVAPLYNYLKPFPEELLDTFYHTYGDSLTIATDTASPPLAMLNSGLQLYWLKYKKPQLFDQICWSLHLPQFLSYTWTRELYSEYTSIGCHTALWHFEKHDYHSWVYHEGIHLNLAPLTKAMTSFRKKIIHRELDIGVGIHDSSAALIPYLMIEKEPFLLISTGTWSISLNAFSNELLSREDLENDCLHFMKMDGGWVRASRLFLGNEYHIQIQKLNDYFNIEKGQDRKVLFNEKIYQLLMTRGGKRKFFAFESISLKGSKAVKGDWTHFSSFEEALHQLMIELMELQINSSQRAVGNTLIDKIYVDGGFIDNDIYINLLAKHFKDKKIYVSRSPKGSALGAALIMSKEAIPNQMLKDHVSLKAWN